MAARRLSKLQCWILLLTLGTGTYTRNDQSEGVEVDGFTISRQELLKIRHFEYPAEAQDSFDASLSRSLANLQTKGLIRMYKEPAQPTYPTMKLPLLEHYNPKRSNRYQARWIMLTDEGEQIAIRLLLNTKSTYHPVSLPIHEGPIH